MASVGPGERKIAEPCVKTPVDRINMDGGVSEDTTGISTSTDGSACTKEIKKEDVPLLPGGLATQTWVWW